MSEDPQATHRVIEPSVLYVGTPVYLVATQNPDGSTNLAPASSHFALGRTIVLGLEEGGQSLDNVRRFGELTVNFPAAAQWSHVERLAGVTGRNPVPQEKAGAYSFELRKFELAGLTPAASDLVEVPMVAEAPIRLEARVLRVTPAVTGEFGMVEAEVVRVHAAREITVEGTSHLNPEAWHPLIYAYRHFYDRGGEVGWTRKTPFVTAPDAVDRWETSGGTWRVRRVADDLAHVELLRCDGGEIVEVLTLTEPADVRWASRSSPKCLRSRSTPAPLSSRSASRTGRHGLHRLPRGADFRGRSGLVRCGLRVAGLSGGAARRGRGCGRDRCGALCCRGGGEALVPLKPVRARYSSSSGSRLLVCDTPGWRPGLWCARDPRNVIPCQRDGAGRGSAR